MDRFFSTQIKYLPSCQFGVFVSSFRQIEQGAHYIRKSLIYSAVKAFPERAVVDLVYKFDDKSTASV